MSPVKEYIEWALPSTNAHAHAFVVYTRVLQMETPVTIDERLKVAEKRIEELQQRPRDFWDKFQIVAGLLIPASITFAGQ
jgi:hypothetical protein